MRRRGFLATVATGIVAGTAGCMGGDVVFAKNGKVTVEPGRGEIFELPSEGEKIKYIARAEQPFDVYLFESREAKEQYRSFLNGESPDNQPAGDQSLGGRAVKMGDIYEMSTEDKGREDLSVDGSAFFVLDHSNYRGETTLGENPDPLSVQIDLEVVESSLPL